MGDDNTERKKRKSKWTTSYSNMTMADSEKRLGIRFRNIRWVSVDKMLAECNYTMEDEDWAVNTKDEVYKRIVQYLVVEGYPSEEDPDFKEANVSDLVLHVISPIIFDFIIKTGRKGVTLSREREIVATDSETGGTEEFVVVDQISVTAEKFVLIIEAKRSFVGQAMKQCLLSLKDARDNNGGGAVYGFVTTGENWRMIRYDGTSFRKTRNIMAVFDGMNEDKELWMKDCSVLVDCLFAAMSNGGMTAGNTTLIDGGPLERSEGGGEASHE
ncbi:hypothetical protein FN846DRAFT_924087 [Sphaerosporella brunnea]|uniref:Uncharacterized protein n=1 Tax=Sphaerosporella brunnea TaxID=1250544 RepID=A0A5J5EBW4_9PEZI|nr:hypothetical protein FN846DRAFT_924087 [Sphaerosporella brunnea]